MVIEGKSRLADLDGDGVLDALVGTQRGTTIWINQSGMQGGQAGIFASSGQKIINGSQTDAVFLADLDNDGDLDALAAFSVVLFLLAIYTLARRIE